METSVHKVPGAGATKLVADAIRDYCLHRACRRRAVRRRRAPSCESELRYLRAKLEFLESRRSWAGMTLRGMAMDAWRGGQWLTLPAETQYEMLTNGKALIKGHKTRMAKPVPIPANTTVGQVGGGAPIFSLLRFEGHRPVWSEELLHAAHHLQKTGGVDALSPTDYPHAATDLIMACKKYATTAAKAASPSSQSRRWVDSRCSTFPTSSITTRIDWQCL